MCCAIGAVHLPHAVQPGHARPAATWSAVRPYLVGQLHQLGIALLLRVIVLLHDDRLVLVLLVEHVALRLAVSA
jgi:hypothetical protein